MAFSNSVMSGSASGVFGDSRSLLILADAHRKLIVVESNGNFMEGLRKPPLQPTYPLPCPIMLPEPLEFFP